MIYYRVSTLFFTVILKSYNQHLATTRTFLCIKQFAVGISVNMTDTLYAVLVSIFMTYFSVSLLLPFLNLVTVGNSLLLVLSACGGFSSPDELS